MCKVLDIRDRLKSNGSNNDDVILRAPNERIPSQNIDPEEKSRQRNNRVFHEHLLGLIESALSIEPTSELERARNKTMMISGKYAEAKRPKFDPSLMQPGEAVFLRHVMHGPLSEPEVVRWLALTLKEMISRSFVYERKMNPSQREMARKALQQEVFEMISKKG